MVKPGDEQYNSLYNSMLVQLDGYSDDIKRLGFEPPLDEFDALLTKKVMLFTAAILVKRRDDCAALESDNNETEGHL